MPQEKTSNDIIDHENHSLGVYDDFTAEMDDEMSLKAGDMVTVLSIVDSDWFRGKFSVMFL